MGRSVKQNYHLPLVACKGGVAFVAEVPQVIHIYSFASHPFALFELKRYYFVSTLCDLQLNLIPLGSLQLSLAGCAHVPRPIVLYRGLLTSTCQASKSRVQIGRAVFEFVEGRDLIFKFLSFKCWNCVHKTAANAGRACPRVLSLL